MYTFRRRAVRRTTVISVGLLSLLIGLFLAYYGVVAWHYWMFTVFCMALLLLRARYGAVLIAVLLGLFCGIWRGQTFYAKLGVYNNLYGQSITVTGVVADDPAYEQSGSLTEFHVRSLYADDRTLVGRIQIVTRDAVHVTRGDRVTVEGKLKASKGTTRQGTIGSAKVKILAKNNSFVEKLRTRFFTTITTALPDPQSSLGLGYLVGVRVAIPKDLEDQLSIVGLTHIVAVSGYNLTIIVQAVRRLVGKRSAYQSVVFAGILVAGFLVVTGGSAPIVRAAVVCGFSLVAWYYGRVVRPLLLLLISGALTAFFNPLYVWGDPGWYLSFLAFGGVLILAPLVTSWLFVKRPPGGVMQVLVETICAQICTVPYTLYLFGGVSLIAPLANILVLPFIPVIMLLVFVTGIIGLVLPMAAALVGVVPSALLTLQIWLIQKLSIVPGARVEGSLSVYGMAGFFFAIVVCILMLARVVASHQSKGHSLTDTDLV